MWRKLVLGALLCLFVIPLMAAGDCGTTKTEEQQRKDSVKTRVDTLTKADSKVPLPKPENFPIRQALADYTTRQDLLNHPWYTYIIGDNLNIGGYYITKTGPISTCNFLSSTEIVDSSANGKIILTAPSLDGIFYGGSGSSSTCGYFFFDYSSDALIILAPGVKFYTADKPLAFEAQPINIK